jgi:dimeric dUTPase (all-alpha-NTP-PPase superfamily)
MQREVDELIRKTQGIDPEESTVDRKIIAFKVEFGEFLNEHKFFKYWKVGKTPHTSAPYWDEKLNQISYKNPMLEEFVDGIAFLLALGIERKWDRFIRALEVVGLESKTLSTLSIDIFHNPLSSCGHWMQCMLDMLQFASLVGLSIQDIEDGYQDKYEINIRRQKEGY